MKDRKIEIVLKDSLLSFECKDDNSATFLVVQFFNDRKRYDMFIDNKPLSELNLSNELYIDSLLEKGCITQGIYGMLHVQAGYQKAGDIEL